MVCLGLEPGAVGWKAQTNQLSYGGGSVGSAVASDTRGPRFKPKHRQILYTYSNCRPTERRK